MNAQNDNCSGAVTLTVGANFASGAITSNNTGATVDGAFLVAIQMLLIMYGLN